MLQVAEDSIAVMYIIFQYSKDVGCILLRVTERTKSVVLGGDDKCQYCRQSSVRITGCYIN